MSHILAAGAARMKLEAGNYEARIAALEAQLAEQETALWARFKDILSTLEATPPAPKVTATTDHDPKLGTTLHLMKQSWESRQPTNSGAPKVTEEMVERGAKKLLLVMPELLRLYPSTAGEVARRDVREVLDAALTAAQEAGKP